MLRLNPWPHAARFQHPTFNNHHHNEKTQTKRLERDVGVPLALEADSSKWFPASNSGRAVRDALVAACRAAGAEVRYCASLEGLRRVPPTPAGGEGSGSGSSGSGSEEHTAAAAGGGAGGGGDDAGAVWECRLRGGGAVRARAVVLATGGLSFPAVGTDGAGHRVARALGHTINQTYAALTPLLGGHPGGAQLAGLSLAAVRLAAYKTTLAKSGSGGGGGQQQPGDPSQQQPDPQPGKQQGQGQQRQQQGKQQQQQQQQPAVVSKKPAGASPRGGFLFTHRGFSGPAALDVSHHVAQAMERGEPPPGEAGMGGSGEWDAPLWRWRRLL